MYFCAAILCRFILPQTHYDPTTDDFDEPMPEEYRFDDEEWDEDTDSDTWIERHS